MNTKMMNGVKFKRQSDGSWMATREVAGALEVLCVAASEFDCGVWVWVAYIDGGEFGVLNNRSISFNVDGDSLSCDDAMKDATEAFLSWKRDLAYLAALK